MPTIAAIATPPGNGGIAIIRISGPGAKPLLSRVFLPHSSSFSNFRPWMLHRGTVLDEHEEPLDDVLAVFMPGPRTYSGEDMAEIHCHGGAYMAAAVLESFLRLGARLAEPGEFTRRAFINGRMDLTQAEAVGEMIAAQSREAARNGLGRLEGRLADRIAALGHEIDELRILSRINIDFPEDEVEGIDRVEYGERTERIAESLKTVLAGAARARIFADGAVVALAGAVNAGKSSLLNFLAGHDRALVSSEPGTTRDYVDARIFIDGLPVVIVDTAGLRPLEAAAAAERMGMEKTRGWLERADLIGLVVDASASDPDALDFARNICAETEKPVVLIWNKTDIAPAPDTAPAGLGHLPSCGVSALTGANMDGLLETLRGMLLGESAQTVSDFGAPPNARQARSLELALGEMLDLKKDIEDGAPYDCCMARLDMAAQHLSNVVRLAPDDELLDRIFSNFCIGK